MYAICHPSHSLQHNLKCWPKLLMKCCRVGIRLIGVGPTAQKLNFSGESPKLTKRGGKSLRRSRSSSEAWTLAQFAASRSNYFARFCFAHLRLCAAAIFARASALRVRLFFAVRGRRDAVEV